MCPLVPTRATTLMLLSLNGPSKVLHGPWEGRSIGGPRVGQEYGGGADWARLTSQELLDLGADLPRRPCPGWPLSSLTCTPLLRLASSSCAPPPTCTLSSPLDEFLEHIPSEVVTNLFDVRLREEGRGW